MVCIRTGCYSVSRTGLPNDGIVYYTGAGIGLDITKGVSSTISDLTEDSEKDEKAPPGKELSSSRLD